MHILLSVLPCRVDSYSPLAVQSRWSSVAQCFVAHPFTGPKLIPSSKPVCLVTRTSWICLLGTGMKKYLPDLPVSEASPIGSATTNIT